MRNQLPHHPDCAPVNARVVMPPPGLEAIENYSAAICSVATMEASEGRHPLLDSAAIMNCIYQCIPHGTEVSPEMSVSEAGFDSLRLSQLVLEIEARLSRELDDDDIESILLSRSIGQIVHEIERVTSKG